MAAVKLAQYLASILSSTNSDTNELRLKAVGSNFDLFTVYLENHNTGVHRYQTTNAMIFYEAGGKSNIKIHGQDFELGVGNIVFLPAKSDYEVQKQTKNDVLVKLDLNSKYNLQYFLGNITNKESREEQAIEQVISKLRVNRLLYLKSTPISKSAQLMNRIIDEYLNQNLFAESVVKAELNLLLVAAVRNQNFAAAPAEKQGFANATLESYIDANFADITLDAAAKYFGFNPNYFSSLVKQKTGKSFVEHVDERRMQEARNLLARPDISVKEIIARVGYNGKSFFYKKFNEYYHQTPVQMRAELFRQANINLK
ncbi:AraC family transcriptional regulator [Lactobacillus sp. ESL0679]|uniref:helix-turn-helix domain-containing protein n=1 Tax=Lactobacillus sp. ESL0679 TaxID=2983209 RepID=UPI0023F6C8D8|nr:AraC family transcriptional regulator [Lactobacillus sp. ESL0679]MDF7682818.1 AraC family transcriptional regulator [Lactobacillus sp. ESL0679]